MATIVTRAGKGTPLTHNEVDANFTNLNTDKIEAVVDDLTPQLGGNLDLNTRSITGTGGINITGNIALTGTVDGRDVAADGAVIDGLGTISTQDADNVSLTGGTLSNVTETVASVTYALASQYDIGTDPNQIPINQYLGTLAYVDLDSIPDFNAGGDALVVVDGRVGIRTSSPASTLHIESNPAYITLRDTDAPADGYVQFGARGGSGDEGTIQVDPNNTVSGSFFSIGIDGSERMRINPTGNVGIGETAPDYKLDVNGTFGFTPGASVTPVDNGDVVFELTNNTTLTVKAKGSDGVVRSGTITLA